MGVNAGRDRRWMVVFLLLAALVLGASRWRVSGQAAGLIPEGRREATPNMTLEQVDGGTWRLADQRGHVVVMNFWATWCEPCQDEMPTLAQVLRETGPQVAMVGIAMDAGPNNQQVVEQFARQYRLPWTVAFPDRMLRAGADGIGIPTTVLLDKHGRRARTYVGEVDRATLAKDVAALLAES